MACGSASRAGLNSANFDEDFLWNPLKLSFDLRNLKVAGSLELKTLKRVAEISSSGLDVQTTEMSATHKKLLALVKSACLYFKIV